MVSLLRSHRSTSLSLSGYIPATIRPVLGSGKRSILIILVSLVSIAAPMIPLFCLALTAFGGDSLRMLFALTFASAFGASGYWLLLPLFWLKSFCSVNLITTIAMCCPATLLGWFVAAQLASAGPGSRVRDVTDLAPTFAWWAAFSLSLYYSDAQRQGGTSIPAVAD